jgi:glycosyltransferase EpsF
MVYFCNSNKKNKFFRFLDEMNQVRKLLKKEKYDVIHCHSCSFIGIFRAAIPGYFCKETKVISHAHSIGTPKNNSIDEFFRFILKHIMSFTVDYGFSCSDTTAKSKYTDKFIHSNAFYIINNAVETDKYSYNAEKRKEIRSKLGIDDNIFLLGHVGRMEYEKNHKFIMEVFEQINLLKSESKLLLVGDGSLFDEMKKLAEQKGIQNAVIFMGQQESAELFYQAMDCFILPSYYEGFPFVLVEAQMNGLRCIVSDKISKTVNISGGVLFLSLERSAKEWAETILEFGQSRLSENQIKKVCDSYDLEKETKKIEKLYADGKVL